jgi:penicillin-binding protein 1C
MLRRLRQRPRAKRWLLVSAATAIGLPLLATVALWLSLPPIDRLRENGQAPSTRILDRSGRLLYEIIDPRSDTSGHHTPVPLDRIPLNLRKATIAVEDASFYGNPGVDLAGIVRAAWINLRGGDALAGGSTITQQLARMLLLDREERTQRTLVRKLRESLLAWQIAQRYSKDEVLALYLNEAYYGNLAYGVEAAARAYFGKSAAELDLAECALLAGLPQSPVAYDPFNDPELAKRRQAIVLDLMVRQGAIDRAEAVVAGQARLSYASVPFGIRAPHFVSYVRRWLEEEFGTDAVARGGLIVTTTLNVGLNDAGEDIVRAHLARLADPTHFAVGHNAGNAALVALDPGTGDILAMVGSPDFFDSDISGAVNATLALRQPGSAIKPITYATALAKGIVTAASTIFDVRSAFPTREGLPYVPVNYDRQHHGPISVRDALATSNNVAAVTVLQRVGLESMLAQANALGMRSFRTADNYGLSLTLGGGEVRLLELVGAYGAFANGGNRVDPIAILRVTDRAGTILFDSRSGRFSTPPRAASPGMVSAGRDSMPAVNPRIAWLISDILSDNAARAPAFGENSVLRLSRPAAVKTGTTTDFRDNWTVGYTPQIVAGVWVGNADGTPMQRISGVSGAGPIWHDFMTLAHRDLPIRAFERPAGLTQIEVCPLSGLLPSPDCGHTRMEWFVEGSQPTRRDDWHRRVRIDESTGVERVMLDLPAPLREWARQRGWPLIDRPYDGEPLGVGEGSDGERGVKLIQPDPGSIFRAARELPESIQRIPIVVRVVSRDVARVEVMLSTGETIARFTGLPYRAFWPLVAGEHTLVARAYYRDGRVEDSAPVKVSVRP